MARLRSTHDREILRLAVPALGALAAEPLYLLTDTAIVGHLGTVELAALALAATLLSALVTLCNFLTYGTTARVARLRGAGSDLVARGFTGDDAVLERAEVMWPLFALLQPVGAAVFALDGILIGAEDTRFIKWSMVFAALGVFVPICLLSLELDWGIVGVWCGLNALMVARLATMGARFARGRWALVGASAR